MEPVSHHQLFHSSTSSPPLKRRKLNHTNQGATTPLSQKQQLLYCLPDSESLKSAFSKIKKIPACSFLFETQAIKIISNLSAELGNLQGTPLGFSERILEIIHKQIKDLPADQHATLSSYLYVAVTGTIRCSKA